MAQEIAAANEELRAANEEIMTANEELSESNQTLARMNAALDQTNKELDRTNKDLDTFVYTASHDLKAPILNIEGLLRALEKQLGKETLLQTRVQQIYELLYHSVNRFKSTIGDLTEVARIGKESTEDVASIDIGDMLEEVLADLAPQLQEAGVKLERSVDCPTIQFSRKNLKSILYNLLSNAIKYRSPDRPPLVRISCQMQEGYILLTVQDNGLGMDMRQEEKIFALFKRLHSHVEGSGIGLYIVKKMIEHAEGKIAVESQVGVGSTFSVYFKR
jgi:signal transduction histidine kinase